MTSARVTTADGVDEDAASAPAVVVRAATDSDRDFLFSLHTCGMRYVLDCTWGWDEARERLAFDSRMQHYHASVIERHGVPVGGLMLEAAPDAIYIQDIQVLPELQGQGIGTAALGILLAGAARLGQSISLAVMRGNPRARQLYQRLGFIVVREQEPFVHMQHRGVAAPPQESSPPRPPV